MPSYEDHTGLCHTAVNLLRRRHPGPSHPLQPFLSLPLGCHVAASELRIGGQHPDAMGWGDGRTLVIECKTTRRDFLKGKEKQVYADYHKDLGNLRWYLTPPNVVLCGDELHGWGHIVWHRGRADVRRTPKWFELSPKARALEQEALIVVCRMYAAYGTRHGQIDIGRTRAAVFPWRGPRPRVRTSKGVKD